MQKPLLAAAGVAAALTSTIALGAGPAEAAPQNCTVERTLLDASATCPPDGGTGYVLHVDCFGLYASGPFPLYAIGPYPVLSYPFTPDGQRVTAGCTGMGPGVVAVVTNAFVQDYSG
ncbi:hypothetical protein [Nocardia sp. NPDC057353]|uniref:hypothetical protein n=1 Tax=Nocardia sp. NPDC057353 TaxID=3346104 RepID=UPI00363E46F8